MEASGYVPVRKKGRDDGRWKIAGRRVTIYALSSLTVQQRYAAAEKRVEKGGGEDGRMRGRFFHDED
jgi:hypothetical protein